MGIEIFSPVESAANRRFERPHPKKAPKKPTEFYIK